MSIPHHAAVLSGTWNFRDVGGIETPTGRFGAAWCTGRRCCPGSIRRARQRWKALA